MATFDILKIQIVSNRAPRPQSSSSLKKKYKLKIAHSIFETRIILSFGVSPRLQPVNLNLNSEGYDFYSEHTNLVQYSVILGVHLVLSLTLSFNRYKEMSCKDKV